MAAKIKTHDLDEILELLDIMELAQAQYCTTDERSLKWLKLHEKIENGKVRIDA